MSNNQTNNGENSQPIRCWRCGRIIWENIKTGRTGCLNTKCQGYLIGSKKLDKSLLRKAKR